MTFIEGRRVTKKNMSRNISTIGKLLKDKRITYDFVVMASSLDLEDLIAIKLEAAANNNGSPLYGVPLWHKLHHIVKSAVIRFALSVTVSNKEASRFLGLAVDLFPTYRNFYKTNKFFDLKGGVAFGTKNKIIEDEEDEEGV